MPRHIAATRSTQPGRSPEGRSAAQPTRAAAMPVHLGVLPVEYQARIKDPTWKEGDVSKRIARSTERVQGAARGREGVMCAWCCVMYIREVTSNARRKTEVGMRAVQDGGSDDEPQPESAGAKPSEVDRRNR